MHQDFSVYTKETLCTADLPEAVHQYSMQDIHGSAHTSTLAKVTNKLLTLLDLCVSSLRRGHANLLCIVPILTDDPRRESGKVLGMFHKCQSNVDQNVKR